MFPVTVTITINDQAELAKFAALFPTTEAKQEAPAAVGKSSKPVKSESAATPASAASTQPTATADAVTAAPEKTVAESNPTAASAEGGAQAWTVVTEYTTLQKKVVELHALDPNAPVPIANAMGFETFKLIPQDRWGEAFDKVQAKIDEIKKGGV